MSEFHVEVGAYALDALDADERAAFEEHLAGCALCRRELAEFSETAARMGALSETPPPPDLRSSILDAIAEVRPLPPLDPPRRVAEQPERRGPRVSDPTDDPARLAREEWPSDDRPTGEDGRAGEDGPPPRRALTDSGWPVELPARDAGSARPIERGERTERNEPAERAGQDELAGRRLRRRSRLLTLAVAAAMVVVLALGGWSYVLQRDRQAATAAARAATAAAQSAAVEAQASNRLLSAPDVQTYPVEVDGASATFVVSKSLDQAMFVGAELPPAPAGRTYQLWTIDEKEHAAPDATFAGGPDTREFMNGDIDDAAALAVSSEPAGGSKTPTLVLDAAPLSS